MRLVLRFMKPYRWLLALTVALMAADVVGALLVPTLAARLLNEGTAAMSFHTMTVTALQMLAASLVAGCCAIGAGYCCSVLAARVAKDMRDAIYVKSLDLSVFDFRQFGTASMVTRTLSDVVNIQMAITNVIMMMLPVPFIFVVSLTFAFSLDTTLAWWLVGAMVCVCVIAVFILRSASPLYRRLQHLLDRIGAVLLENLTGVRVVRAFGKEAFEEVRMNKAFSEYATTSIKANRLFANLDGLSYLFITLFIIAVYWLCGGRITAGAFQIGDIVAIIEYAVLALFYLMAAQMVIAMLPRALECCHRVREVLDLAPSVNDPGEDRAVDMTNRGPLEDGEVLAFDDVTFRFADAEEDTLRHVSFTVRTGETVAIIGATGSGKSTIASLAMRFHDASWGHVLVDGVDVRDMRQHDLRERIAYVQQRAWLFSGDVESNLLYRDADADSREVANALTIAQANAFIDQTEHGVATRVAQGGTNFSGGQRQRLSIARALVGDAQLVIFDDSFSALDFATDAALRKALREHMRDRAMLIIAQRVSTIAHADRIIVLDDGHVVGTGTHDELLRGCEVYREIVASQVSESERG
ncbi:ABC transporter ATP-binding protein [Bifidobacterium pseudolongum]|uniref:ATP-binding and permease protein of ABC transporter n=1 Tax=Bifidobacterium pseudolongum subsp. globosum TaxID=1690 RepID=A0A2N3R4P8_9BIFI|nr:ABC transporter ATP-binding protein [Bifidobacterium pseudolongum]PKV03591.1 aTP-binding and permease protein of ABC transporter [Bifidobacterium pseudolongum subsp. globosum]